MKYRGCNSGGRKRRRDLKVVLVPYPAQGHVTPMLRLASALLRIHGGSLEPVLVVPEFIHRRISPQINDADDDGVVCLSIPDGLGSEEEVGDFFAIEKAMEKDMPFHLERILLDLQKEEEGDDDDGVEKSSACVMMMIVDLLASYAINVGRRCGVAVAGFWPAMLATYRLIASIPDLVQAAIISDDSGCPLGEAPICFSAGQPTISATEMPWLIGTSTARKLRFKFWKRALDRLATVEWLLVNTFVGECDDNNYWKQYYDHGSIYNPNTNSTGSNLNVIPIGPLNITGDDASASSSTIHGSFWEEDRSCLDWLDRQKSGSVIYISFGSWVSPIGEAKVKSLAMALESLNLPFLWVLAPAWLGGLPESFIRLGGGGGSKRVIGRVVWWVPQKEVLRHEAVACYLTHCGWNSTMEAIECKKRMLCYPIAGDQFLNCAYIVDAWRVGVRLHGLGTRDLEEAVKQVMEDHHEEMSGRMVRLNQRLKGKDALLRATANLTSFLQTVISQDPCL